MLGRDRPGRAARSGCRRTRPTPRTYAIDFVNLEQVAPIANPDPATYTVPAGFTHQDVQNALDTVRHGHHRQARRRLPAGRATTRRRSKFQVYGKAVKVVGAGPVVHPVPRAADAGRTPTSASGAEATANGSTFANFAYFGNYTVAHRRPGQGVRLRQRRRTSPSTTSGSSTWCACTGAPTPTT